jgi:hypothetical protein
MISNFNFKLLMAASMLVTLANCAFAPLSDPITPQTLGKGNQSHSLTAGYPYFGYTFTTGVSDTFDVGLQMESQVKGFTMGARAMLEATDYVEGQWNMSLLTGAGLTTEGSYVFLGTVHGKKFGFYELSFVPRFNFLNITDAFDEDIVQDADDQYSLAIDTSGEYYYLSLSVANTFWFRPTFGLSLIVAGAYVLPWSGSSDSGFVAPYGGIALNFK